MGFAKGDRVWAREYGGRDLDRRVVRELETRVVICTEEEFTRAESEGRDPDGVGFPRKDVRHHGVLGEATARAGSASARTPEQEDSRASAK